MKFLLSSLTVLFSVFCFGQDYLQKEMINTETFKGKSAEALKYSVKEVQKDALLKIWKKEINSQSESVDNVSEFQIEAKNFVHEKISKNPYTVLLNVVTKESGVEMIIAVQDSVGFLKLSSDAHKGDFEAYFEEIIKKAYVERMNEKLAAEQKKLNQIDDDIKKQYKLIAKNEKTILKLETEIENTKTQLEMHASQYDALLNTIQQHKTELATTSKNDENYKVIKKEVKNLEKNKKTMESDNLKNKELIYDHGVSIEEIKKAIETSKETIVNLEEQKTSQKQVIVDLEQILYELR